MVKIIIMFSLCFSGNYCFAQPGYDYARGRQEIEDLTKLIEKYPDSSSLYEQRFDLINICGPFKQGVSDINYLLKKDPKAKNILLKKAHLYKSHYALKDSLDKAIPYYNKYFKEETDLHAIKKTLVSLGRGFKYEKKYNKAIAYFDKALAVNSEENGGYYSDKYILNYKVEVYHESKKYEEALKIIENIEGELSLRAIKYNNVNIYNFQKSKKNIVDWFYQNYNECITNNEFLYTSKDGTFKNYVDRYILELAYTEYKLGNTHEALDILYNYVVFDYKNLYISMGEIYEPYWCMYTGLYKLYPNSYKMKIIMAYKYTCESHGLVSFDDDSTCQPIDIMNLEFNSWNDMELKINETALIEIEKAEKLANKTFDLFRAVTLREMDKRYESFVIIFHLLEKDSLNYSAHKVRYLSNLSKPNNKNTDKVNLGINNLAFKMQIVDQKTTRPNKIYK